MTYIENVFLCMASPLLIAALCMGKRQRKFFLFCFAGMGVCLLSAYINTFFAALYKADTFAATTEIAPVVEDHDTPSASTLGPGTHSASHASLSSIQPITPAPRTIPSYERAVAAQTPSTPATQTPSDSNASDDKADNAETVAPTQMKPFVAEQPQTSETLSSLASMVHETSSIPQSSSSFGRGQVNLRHAVGAEAHQRIDSPTCPMPSSAHTSTESTDQSQNSVETNDDARATLYFVRAR